MDTMARAIALQMQAKLGQPVIVENRPGAGTTIGAKSVVTADPDGLTLLWGTLSMIAIAPVLYKDLDFDPKTLVPVALVAEFPSLLVIPPSLPAKTMAEFIAYAKANRGKLNYGGSLGTPPQLMGAMFNKVADLGMTYVPYRGGAPSMPDLIAGRLQMQFDALTLLVPLVNEGKLRALAVQGAARWPGLPDVPTLREAGFADFPGNAWGGIMAPPKTPPAHRAKAQRHRERDPQVAGNEGGAEQVQRAAEAGFGRGIFRLHRARDAEVERDGQGVGRDRAVGRAPVAIDRARRTDRRLGGTEFHTNAAIGVAAGADTRRPRRVVTRAKFSQRRRMWGLPPRPVDPLKR